MRDLPGFYFDAARQRYFPESSRPKQASASSVTTQLLHPSNLSKSRRWKGHALNFNASIVQVQKSRSRVTRDKAHHIIISQQVAASTSESRVSMHVPIVYSAPITSLCISAAVEDRVQRRSVYLGDRQGWCYASERCDAIIPEHCLSSEITSIQASEKIVVYTSFGPNPQILVRDALTLESCILRPSQLQDVRASQLKGRSLTLGMRKKALHIIDLDNPRQSRSLETYSDVFALHRDNNNVWTGARNGAIRLFDLRTSQGQDVLGGRFEDKRVSITHLQRIREYQLLISATDGNLEIFDVRSVGRSAATLPIQSLRGQVNTYTQILGFAVDPSEEFLFAAGQDQRIRVWSFRTGDLLEPPQKGDRNGIFARTFTQPVHAMQVTSDGHTNTLWIASGTKLECFELGKCGPVLVS